MHKYKIFIIMFIFYISNIPSISANNYAVAVTATPVFNTPVAPFYETQKHPLKTDRCGQTRELEFIALPGSAFSIVGKYQQDGETVFEVTTKEYKAGSGVHLYINQHFVDNMTTIPEDRKRTLPTRDKIIATLLETVGEPYQWGGNWSPGILGIRHGKADKTAFKGVDCSGLLYQATGGWTPRNTWQLLSFGKPIDIQGKNTNEIKRLLQPLDLIVWNGHVLIVIDEERIIESRLECGKKGNGGVVVTNLNKRLNEIMKSRKAVNFIQSNEKKGSEREFVVRRWFNTL